MKKALSRVRSHLVGCPQFTHLTTLPECWPPSACSPRRSARKQAQALRMSDRSVRRILRSDLSLHPYKLQVVHALSNRDREMRLQFCRQFVGMLTENPDLPNKLLVSGEAHFHLHDTVNKQNFWYWSAANPHELHQRPTYDTKVTVWCAVWSREVTGPSFFEDEDGKATTFTSQRYTEMINEFLSPNLPPNNGTLWFQQDGATAHTAVIWHRCASPFVSAAGDFSFRWSAMASPFAEPNRSRLFSVGLFEK